jgi:hypothetical protein
MTVAEGEGPFTNMRDKRPHSTINAAGKIGVTLGGTNQKSRACPYRWPHLSRLGARLLGEMRS